MRKLFYSISFLIAVIVINACSVGKKYQRPTVQLPQQFDSTTATDSSIAGIEWRNFFKDTTLISLIDSALNNSYDLQLAVKRIEEAEAYVKQAKMNYVPTVDVAASAVTSNPSNNSLDGKSLASVIGKNHVEDYTLSATVSWDIYSWGKIKYEKEATLANYLATYEGARTVQTTLIAEIATGYYNLLMLDKQLSIAQKNVALTDTLVNMMKLQKAAGQVTELAVQQTEVQQQTAALLIPQLEQQIAIQENTIKILSGELPSSINRTGNIETAYVWDNLSAGFPAELLSRRPDVRANEMVLVAANANVGAAKASMYPSLNITASGGLNAFKASKWFTMPASLFFTAAGTIAQPVLQHRELKTRYEVSAIQRDEAVITFRQSVLNAGGEVVNALVQLNKLKTQQQIALAQVDTLHKAIGNATLLFKSGLADYLEVITAQSNSLNAELNLADIQRQRLAAAVELYRALGGGWQ
jgi:NodT family efflux transporter outer membrane factor (OMF) lipoprotein